LSDIPLQFIKLSLTRGLWLREQTAPDTPPSNSLELYCKDNSGTSALYLKDDAGTESRIGDTSILAPTQFDFPSAASPAQTAEGRAVWDSDDDKLTIGDGSSRKTFTPTATMSGDVTQDTAGVTTIGADKVTTAKIINDAVTYAKIQNVSAADRLLGRSTAGSGDVEEITVGGDITQSGSTFTIGNDKVTYAKMQNVSAASKIIGRGSAGGSGDPEELSIGTGVAISATTLQLDTHTHQSSGVQGGVLDHGAALTGLTDDDHTQYALLAGRSGGQILIGDTASAGNLTLQSTAHATRGKILFGTSAYDEVNNRLGIGRTDPPSDFTIATTSTNANRGIEIEQFGANTNAAQLSFKKSRGATIGSFSATLSGDFLFGLNAFGCDGSAFHSSNIGQFAIIATETHSSTAGGCKATVALCPNGSVTKSTVLTLDQDGGAIFGGYAQLPERSANPTAPPSSAGCNVYTKADNFVIQFNDADTTRYLFIPMTGTGTAWTHDTTGP
jgi:Repeat of unknown function (DUF5907)